MRKIKVGRCGENVTVTIEKDGTFFVGERGPFKLQIKHVEDELNLGYAWIVMLNGELHKKPAVKLGNWIITSDGPDTEISYKDIYKVVGIYLVEFYGDYL